MFAFSQDGVVLGMEVNHRNIYDMMEMQELAIALFLVNQRALGNSSAWEPYFRILPKHVPSVRIQNLLLHSAHSEARVRLFLLLLDHEIIINNNLCGSAAIMVIRMMRLNSQIDTTLLSTRCLLVVINLTEDTAACLLLTDSVMDRRGVESARRPSYDL